MNNSICTLIIVLISTFAIGQQEVTIIDIDDDGDGVIEISGDTGGTKEYKQMILGFNQSNDGWMRMTTAHKLSFWTKNRRQMTIDTLGRVGIGTSSPTELLDVRGNTSIEGSLEQVGSSNTHIESTAGTITIKTAGATVTIDENGNINIDAAKNISINAQGDIDMSAQNISMTALSSIDLSAGDDITQTANQNINFDAGDHFTIDAQDYDLQTVNLATSAVFNAAHTVGSTFTLSSFHCDLNSYGLITLDAPQINLNSGVLGAARRADSVVSGQIASGSGTVLIGN